jgi:hypothetical protein
MSGGCVEEIPAEGSTWMHHNGAVYKVMLIANADSRRLEEYPVTVVYQGVLNGKIWARKLTDWHRSFTFVE